MHDLTDLGPLVPNLQQALERLERQHVAARLWNKDHTLWRDDPKEISDRLGWLDLVADPPARDGELDALLAAAHDEGLKDVVLLGMGGSSLGAEALRASFGDQENGPRLHVLDSTHPRWVERVRRQIDPASALFLLASKSGTTAEVLAFFHYFWSETANAVGEAAGHHFVAITDPETPLVALARERDFRHTFLNPSDIGGRFSVLSRFGLVAAALAGIDPYRLLASGHAMAARCRPSTATVENPGLWLGAVLGAAAAAGRDQLTLLTTPRIACFGLWAEQLIAESTGKDGKGILPVTGEPIVAAERYSANRLFVALRLAGDADSAFDEQLRQLAAASHPVVVLELGGLHDLGGELFRWQLATAVAGHLLSIQPFDQPDVQSAKTETRRALAAYEASGELPSAAAEGDLATALRSEELPRYVALMAYTDSSPAFEEQITILRRLILERDGIATTFGYGPRFLHSTGQLHKGGPDGGLYVQLLAETTADLPISGQSYGFGPLIQAQAAGDLAALRSRGRRTVRLDLGADPVASLVDLIAKL